MNDEKIIRIGLSVILEEDKSGYWVGTVALPSWAGVMRGSDKAAYVEIEQEPSPTQRDACAWLLNHEAAILNAVLDAVLAAYPDLQRLYDYDEEEGAELMPPIGEARELVPLINLRRLHFHDIVNGTLPYIGFEFACRWDQEHGLGVLMHGFRAVKVGGADTAFLEWVADRDAAASGR